MKASALILVSFLVGALATVALANQAQSAPAVSGVASPEVGGARAIVEPARTMTPRKPSGRSTREYSPARITIPRLGLTANIGTNLDTGPIWWPVTGRPGGGDTVAIAGHRTTHTHPFLDLDLLATGDLIDVRWEDITHRYVMTGRRILSSTNRHIADARGHEVLLLTACTPKGSARQRIVVYAQPAKSG